MEPKKYQYIDSLRGLAILLVLVLHCGQAGIGTAYFPTVLVRFIENGQYGVQLFFMVSAYTLMWSYYSRNNESHATRNFFIRRFLRVAPMYYLAIAYYYFQNFAGFGHLKAGMAQDHTSVVEVLANVFFLNGLKPEWINHLVPGGWSIAVEFTFYFFLPLICKRIKTIDHSIVFLFSALLLSSVLRLNHVLGSTALNNHNFLYWFFPNQLPIFALGIFAFFVAHGGPRPKTSSLLLITTTCFIYCYLDLPEHFAYSLPFFVLLLTLSKHSLKLFVNKITTFIGKLSFSIYLVHFAVLYWLEILNRSDFINVSGLGTALANYTIRYGVVLAISCLICYFTYNFIELPFMKLGKRLIARISPAPVECSPTPGIVQPVGVLSVEEKEHSLTL